MERLNERLQVAERALNTLLELVALERPSTIERDASIQRFEYSFEAVWKVAKRYLNVIEGVDASSPKAVIRSSLEAGLFDEPTTRQALVMADDRNLTSHTYNALLADEIFSRLKGHAAILQQWLVAINDRVA